MVKSFMVVYLPSVEHLLERRGVHVARKPSASFLECAIRLEVREGDPRSRPLLGGGTGSWIEGSGCWKSCVGGTFRTSASRSSATSSGHSDSRLTGSEAVTTTTTTRPATTTTPARSCACPKRSTQSTITPS